ncbi:fasciclin domain-containing protein [bacterium]|nr:fasciclin domain-containing protein [bacterium]MBU1652153.1 fasciclin domain-containing protein [bacterium]
MKKLIVLTIMAAVVLMYGNVMPAAAHCGSCGVGDDHAHAAKTADKMACGCDMSEASMHAHAKMNLMQMADHAGSFNTLLTAVKAAGLEETLQSAGPYTLFAPSDEAFAKLPKGELDKLLGDKDKLRALLTYHVHSGMVKSDEVMKAKSLSTVNGDKAMIHVGSSGVMIDNATVTMTDIECSNGVIHVIDKVILPKELTS